MLYNKSFKKLKNKLFCETPVDTIAVSWSLLRVHTQFVTNYYHEYKGFAYFERKIEYLMHMHFTGELLTNLSLHYYIFNDQFD